MRNESFLKWWLLFVLMIVGTGYAILLKIPQNIWIKDASFLSAATFAIFIVQSIACGNYIGQMGNLEKMDRKTFELFGRREEMGWFVSELCLNLGMLGTIIGFVMMLTGFETLDISNVKTVQGLLSELGKSMATALYTTMVGLICGQLLKLQYFLFAQRLASFESQLCEVSDADEKAV